MPLSRRAAAFRRGRMLFSPNDDSYSGPEVPFEDMTKDKCTI